MPLPAYTICQVWHPRVDADRSHRWLRQRVARASAEVAGTLAKKSADKS